MLLIEHLLVIVLVCIFCFLLFLVSALLAQLIDIDHICKNVSFVGNLKLLYKGAKAMNMGEFPDECFCLQRGIFHSVKLFYIEILVLIVLSGLVFGHGVHLITDGYNIFGIFGGI
jgi:hypothetical protein